MKAPEKFRGMKKVKEYPNFVLYIDNYGRRECFQYWDLGYTTYQLAYKNAHRSKYINL